MAQQLINAPQQYSDYAAEAEDLQRRQAYADLLRAQSMKPIQGAGMAGRTVAPISWAQGASQLLQSAGAGLGESQILQDRKKLADRYQRDLAKAINAGDSEALMRVMPQLGTQMMLAKKFAESLRGGVPSTASPATGPSSEGMSPSTSQYFTGALGLPPSTQFATPPQQQAAAPSAAPPSNGPYGIPYEAFTYGGMVPGGKEVLDAMIKERTPINMREGSTAFVPGTGPIYTAPKEGIQTVMTPQGPVARPVQNFSDIKAAQGAQVAAGQAAGTAYGGAPYHLGTVNTPGAPTLMTTQQQIESATGRPMPTPNSVLGGLQSAPQNMGAVAGYTSPSVPGVTVSGAPGESAADLQRRFNAGRTAAGIRPEAQQQRVPGLPLQDQGAGAEQRKVGEQMGEYVGKVQDVALKSALSNRYLDTMEAASKDIPLGKLAPFQSTLIQWAQALKIPLAEDDLRQAGSTQALTSMAIKLAGEATRQSDAQPSQLQYFKILESMPDAARSPQGFQGIVAYMRDINNYNIEKHQALQQWREQRGTAEGFEAAWPQMAARLPLVWNQQRITGGIPKQAAPNRPGAPTTGNPLVDKWLNR